MKIIIFGLGSIGQRHAKILLKNYDHQLFAFRSGKNKEKNKLGIQEIFTWKKVEKLNPDIAFITNPTSLHIKTAIKCSELGCKLFIEKPIGKDLKDLNKLLKNVKNKKLISYVSYNMRFHPVVIYLKKMLKDKIPLHLRVVSSSFYPKWRVGRNHLEVYSANTKMGGGVILDLSHELDYLYFLLGNFKKIHGNFSRRSNVTVDAEDYVDIFVETNICPVNIHIDFFSQLNQRYIQIDFSDLTVIGYLLTGEIKEYQNEKLKKSIRLDYDRNLMFERQLKYFFANLKNPEMMNNLIEASSLYKKIINFKNNEK